MAEVATLTPSTVDEAAAMIREAQADRSVLLPCGKRTRISRHAPHAAPQRWLSMAGLRAVRWLDVEDQTCEVEAGMSPATLAALLDEHGLELSIDAPCAEEGTLGGLFLSPDVSLLHTACGPPRDQVLGAEWLLADGTRIRSGARVVKSVAGYDLTRLLLGSRGRLAACTALTLRLRPKPRVSRWYRGEALRAWRRVPGPLARRALQTAPGAPLFLEYADGDLPPGGGAEPCSPEDGEHARDLVLSGFARAPQRLASTSARIEVAHLGADWNALQFAVPALHPMPSDAGRVPGAEESPWLARIAQACAPGTTPFGGPVGGNEE